jgi:hypothetical protein
VSSLDIEYGADLKVSHESSDDSVRRVVGQAGVVVILEVELAEQERNALLPSWSKLSPR